MKIKVHNDIAIEDWFTHFKDVLEVGTDNAIFSDTVHFEHEQNSENWFNQINFKARSFKCTWKSEKCKSWRTRWYHW